MKADTPSLPEPFYKADGITLYCGDCREILPLLPVGDACFADPPYGETKLAWDVWPAGWPSLVRPLCRSLWCFGTLRMFLDKRDEFKGWDLAQDVVWEKHNGSGMHKDRFRKVHELAVQFYQGEWGDLFKAPVVVDVIEDRSRKTLVRGIKPQHWGGIEHWGGYEYDGKRMMRSVVWSPSCHGYAVNETQKPEFLVDPLMRYSVPPGGLVIVPFAGSGTDLVVARRQGKRAIGIETRESQCVEIVKRLTSELALVEG